MEDQEMGKRMLKDLKETVCMCVCVCFCVGGQGLIHLVQKRLRWQANVNTELHIWIIVNTVTINLGYVQEPKFLDQLSKH